MLTDNESLENRRKLLKGTTGNIISQEGGFLGNFLVSLMRVGLLLMKNVLTPLTRSVLVPLELMTAA